MNKNQLQRDGISQGKRLLEALKSGYVSVDERKICDLKDFAEKYASLIRYHGIDKELNKNWASFFDKKNISESDPHYALFITFLELFKYAQDHINTLTKRHLDFYYQEVLQLGNRKAQPDKVNVIFELAKNIGKSHIGKGTLLKAGKDVSGKELFYKVDKDIVVNTAQVSSLKSIFVDKSISTESRIYSAAIANSSDGKGKELKGDEPKWDTFGKSQWIKNPEDIQKDILLDDAERTMELAEVGFAFSSPLLFLKEGNRTITITIILLGPEKTRIEEVNKFNLLLKEDFIDAFNIYLSGEKEWIGPYITDAEIHIIDPDRNLRDLILEVIVPKDQPAITRYDAEILGGNFNTKYPVIKFLLNQEADSYDRLSSLSIKSVKLKVDVKEVYDLILQNDTSKLDPSKPFQPFGPIPLIGSNFYIGSSEVFQKKLSTLNLHFEWENAPQSFSDHYKAYPNYPKDNSQFKAEAGMLFNKNWYSITGDDISSTDNFDIYVDKSAAKNYRFRIKDDTGEIILNSEEGYSTKKEMKKIIELVYVKGIDENNYDLKTNEMGKYYFNLVLDEKRNILARSQQYYSTISERNTERDRVIDYLSQVTFTLDSNLVELFDQDSVAKKDISFTNISETLNSKVDGYGRIGKLIDLEKYDKQSQFGFMKLNLIAPNLDNFTAFGHKEYPLAVTKGTIELSKYILEYDEDDSKAPVYSPPALPNEPYTPTIKSIYLDYISREKIIFQAEKNNFQNRVEKFIHIDPFGDAERHPYLSYEPLTFPLLPQYNHQGNLYIGINNLKSPQRLSILFQVAEGSADPEIDLDPQGLKWFYLSNDQWKPFSELQIVAENTMGFQTSGIITFDIPEEASDNNTILPSGLHWIRASLGNNTKSVCSLIELRSQAATVSFVDHNNDPSHLLHPLKANTISKLAVNDAAIKSVSQPYASFRGKPSEQDNSYYSRVSERLRHKNRAVTIWDYERLVLENFPSIYKVKCLNHTDSFKVTCIDHADSISPGAVTLIVIENLRNKNAVDLLKPKTSRNKLIEIKNYLGQYTSPFVELEVENPVYEEVLADFVVGFYKEYDPGFYGQLLNEEIKKFLSPWAYEEGKDIVLTGKIHKSVILKFIEDREYVDFVNQFRLYHILCGVTHIGAGIALMALEDDPKFIVSMEDTDVIEATSSKSVLVSAPEHNISVLDASESRCDGGELGIGHMMIDVNFEVN